MNGPARILAVLQLFEGGPSVWTVEEIGRALDLSTSTAYRSVRALVSAGMLEPVAGAGYALGPAFIRYDRLLRQSDPLILVADPVMRELRDAIAGRGTLVLCRRFRDCVMCVHEVRGPPPYGETTYERGVAMPMFVGASSKAILASLPDRLLKSAYLENEAAIRASGPKSWAEFKEHLREIKRLGYALTDSEVAPGRIGLAAPIFRGDQVVAGISLVVTTPVMSRAQVEAFVPKLQAAAEAIGERLSDDQGLPR
ncbi:HTH-type transcriptional regulator KipR [Rhodoplanes serenus]|uniref:HTH-type transcriptional regulator KipR n=1 Tax=Rhodoplanes serenus TaxID=200615 RepID=A0A447CW96_9BRAD|nr:IclR family transcriptional regulator [Rhodoplanes serenus]MBI5114579.1 IclR family transcriptional regulator [Rhodovulum sp.]VCU09489.1 HTH-type transcriptional regulator KipR [Rhodoplanes serenus]